MKRLRTIPALALALVAATAGSAGAVATQTTAAQPTGLYAGMGTCPLSSAQLQNPDNGEVGCVIATVSGGAFTVGGVTVPISSAITAKFGAYWPNDGPSVTFPDGTTASLFSTVTPTDGKELSSKPIDVPVPGLANFFPGVTSAITQVELAGPITDFAPLATGENFPLFRLPIKLHLLNLFLGLNCYVGSNTNPILLEPTTGTTSPPPPNQPISGDPGSIAINNDPNGFGALVVGFTGASLVDNSFSVPSAGGCGIGGSLNWLVNLLFGLGSAAGHNTLSFTGVNTTLAADTSVSDLADAIAASAK